ncbi:hypothetical protein ACT2VT_000798 [Pantoea agglomerans]
MNVNMSSNIYSYVKNTAGDISKSSGSQPAVESSSTENLSLKSGLSSISGQGLMMSRLFGNADTVPPVQTQLTKTTQDMDASNFLTQDDRTMLSGLYAQAQEQGTDLRYVDDLARDLGGYRKFGNVSGDYNSGNTYDMSGRKQTIEFTAKDAETAARILSSGNVSSSVLDPGFLKYELNSGLSFSHTASFDYIESVVNQSGKSGMSEVQNKTSADFSTYTGQGQNNYVVNTASEVTFKAEEPDVISKDGVFTITETGKKHGFRLEGNSVVQDKGYELDRLRPQNAITLMDYFSNNKKKDEISSEKSTTLFDYLFSSKSGS